MIKNREGIKMDEIVYVFHAPGEEYECLVTQNYCYVLDGDRYKGGAERVFHGNFEYNGDFEAVDSGGNVQRYKMDIIRRDYCIYFA